MAAAINLFTSTRTSRLLVTGLIIIYFCCLKSTLAATANEQYFCPDKRDVDALKKLGLNAELFYNLETGFTLELERPSTAGNLKGARTKFAIMTPCKKPTFTLEVNDYDPNVYPDKEDIPKASTSDGKLMMPSCRNWIEKVGNFSEACDLGEEKKLECKKHVDAVYEEKIPYRCSTSFDIRCNFSAVTKPIEDGSDFYYFDASFWAKVQTGDTPCPVKLIADPGYYLLIDRKAKAPFDPPLRDVEKCAGRLPPSCPTETRPPKTTTTEQPTTSTTVTTTSTFPQSTATPNATSTIPTRFSISSSDQTTEESSDQTKEGGTLPTEEGPKAEAQHGGSCLKEWPFLILYVLFALALIALLALIVAAVCKWRRRRSSTEDEKAGGASKSLKSLRAGGKRKSKESVGKSGSQGFVEDKPSPFIAGQSVFDQPNVAGSFYNGDVEETINSNYTSEFKDGGVDVPATREDGPNDVKQTSARDDDGAEPGSGDDEQSPRQRKKQQEDDANYSNQLDLGLDEAEDEYFE